MCPSLHPVPSELSTCPLCGQPNRCAMEVEKATGQKQPPCWCVSEKFSPALLRQLPPGAQACICQACVRQTSTS